MIRPLNKSCSTKRPGFTLLELLVATTIMAVLVGSLYSVFRGVLNLRETTYEAVETGLPRSYIITLLKRDISNMAAPAGILAGPVLGETQQAGDYRLDRLEFFTTSGIVYQDQPWPDLQKVEYYLIEPDTADNGKGYDFVRAVTRNLLASVVEEPEQERLLSNVISLQFSYFDGEYWQDSWDSTTVENKNPLAVKVNIEFATTETGQRNIAPMELICEIAAEPRTANQESNENRS